MCVKRIVRANVAYIWWLYIYGQDSILMLLYLISLVLCSDVMVTSAFTKYWPPSTSWRLCLRLHMTIEKVKAINRFYWSVFDRKDISSECFNWDIQNYWLTIRFRSDIVRRKWFLSLLRMTRTKYERWGVHVPWSFQWWLQSVLLHFRFLFYTSW